MVSSFLRSAFATLVLPLKWKPGEESREDSIDYIQVLPG